MTFSTCSDDESDTVLVIDGEHLDNDACGRNERDVSPAQQLRRHGSPTNAIRVRFFDATYAGTLRLSVACTTSSPTAAPTTHDPTVIGATFSPTSAPTDHVPDGCGYAKQDCGLHQYCCWSSGLQAAPLRSTFADNTNWIDLYSNNLSVIEPTTFSNLTALSHLNLGSNALTAIEPTTFTSLTALTWLDLSFDALTAIEPTTFSNLTALTWLDLNSNALTAIQPTTFSKLVTLTTLDLHSNALTVLEPTTLSNLAALTVLKLDSNALTVMERATFSNLAALTELDLRSNALSVIEPTTFSSLTALRALYLHFNALTMIEPTTFSSLADLTRLTLHSNALTAIEPTTFSTLTDLIGLTLHSNVLKVIERATFSTLVTLDALRLDSNELTMIELMAFSNLAALTELDLPSNALTVIEPTMLSNLAALTYLDLSSNALTAIEPMTFSTLTALTYLDLSSNALTAIPATAFSNLAALTGLYLYSNSLTVIEPTKFSNLAALITLDLRSNLLTVIEPTTFSNLAALIYLFLDSNALTVIEPATFSNLVTLDTLGLHSTALTAIEPTTFSNLAALTVLTLHSNALTVIERTTFSNLAALRELYLDSNALTMIEPTTFSSLTALYQLTLDSNALTALQNGTFAALSVLHFLDLSANRIEAIEDGVFDFAAMYGRLTGLAPQQGVPNFLYNPNPLECGTAESTTSTWAGTQPLRCTLCTQGYVNVATGTGPRSHRRHVTCVSPHFQLNGDDLAGTSLLGTLQDGLDNSGSGAYIGEELDIYGQTTTENRTFEPKRDKFRGYAPGNNSFDAIRFEVKVGNIDIGCGAVVVGGLNDPGTVVSRIRQGWMKPPEDNGAVSLAPVLLFNGTRQRLLRFEVLSDGIFDFTSCGSRFPASLGIYNASCNGTDGSLVDCIVKPDTGEQDLRYNQECNSGGVCTAPGAPVLRLPKRYGCLLGSSASLTNVLLAKGAYLLGVQPLPRSPTPYPPNDVFEVEMRCHSDGTAAPLDPTDGGVTVNPVTGQLTVSPGKRATPGDYTLNLTAVDLVGNRTTLLRQTLRIQRRKKLDLTPGCGDEVNTTSTANIRDKNFANGPAGRHDLGSVVVFPAFLSDTDADNFQ